MGKKIFITLGSQKFQFNRLLKDVDELTAKVTDFNESDRKISLSIKALTAPEATEDADEVAVNVDEVIAAQTEE